MLRKKQRALEECKIGLKKQVETKRQLEKLRKQARQSNSKSQSQSQSQSPVGGQETLKTRDADILLFDALEKRRRKTYLDQLKNNEELVVEEVAPCTSLIKNKKHKSCPVQLSPIVTMVNKKDEVICIDSDDEDGNRPNIVPNKTSLLKPILTSNKTNSPKAQNQNNYNSLIKIESRTESSKVKSSPNNKSKLESPKASAVQHHSYLKVKNFASTDSTKIYREAPVRTSETSITAQVLLQQKTLNNLLNPQMEALANAICKQVPEGRHIEYKLMNNYVFLLQKTPNQKVENIYQLGLLNTDLPVTKTIKIDNNNASITVPISKSPAASGETKKRIHKLNEDKAKICTAEKIINGQLMRLQLFPKKKN